MARFIKHKKKYFERFGLLAGTPKKRSLKKAKTAYGIRLEEKQKVKFVYQIGEKQFSRYVKKALAEKENPHVVLLRMLETRLDNVVYRSGFASTRPQARQLVSHAHLLVDGRKFTIPSYILRPGQTLELKREIYESPFFSQTVSEKKTLPAWIERRGNKVTILRTPGEGELPQEFNMHLVFEAYR